MKKEQILVVGASGNVGSELVRILKKEGHLVRSTTSRAHPKPDQARIDVATGAGIREAFEGIDRAFLLSPPGFADQHAVLSPLIQEAKRRGLKKVVLMTALGANLNDAAPFRKAEIELEKSGLEYNIIRPNWFFQNFNTFWVHGIRAEGKILVPAGQAKVSFIDTRDVARVAAKLLVSDDHSNQAFDLTGPESVDPHDVAKAISKATGRPVTYSEISPAALKNGLLAAGLPEGYVDFLLLIFGFLREGYNAGVNTNVKTLSGTSPRSLEQYVEDFRSHF